MPPCRDCQGNGYTVTPDRKIVQCHCFIEQRNRGRLDDACVPRALQDSRIEDFFPTKDADHRPLSNAEEDMKDWAREVVSAYIEHLPNALYGEQFTHAWARGGRKQEVRGNTLLLVGHHRSGKSLLAAAIARAALVDLNIVAAYVEWSVLVDTFYNTGEKGEAMRGLVSASTSLLIVENIRPDVVHDWVKLRIDAAFAERNRLMLPTVFTTSEFNIHRMLGDGFGPVLGSMLREAATVNLPSGKTPGEGGV